jgi:ABC-2 type transport system ATP-binding protein
MTAILEVENLRKAFRSSPFRPPVEALRGVSFSAGEGACLGCLGQNGAGKTTTLKILTGQIRADSGSARLFSRSGADPAARRELGYLPENPYFHDHLSPLEGLTLYGRLSGMAAREVAQVAPGLLEKVGLFEVRHRRVRSFSKGMRQRYGLATALLASPRLLLLDEPLSGLDPAGRKLVKDVILEQHRAGRTIVLCSHVLADVQEICERVVVLHQGRVVRDGSISTLLDREARAFELRARDVPEALVARVKGMASRFAESAGGIEARLPGEDLAPQLAREIVTAGGTILALVPERETLEEWFVRLTADAAEPLEADPAEAVA